MSSEWNACSLGDFVRLQRGHDLPAAEQKPGPVPVMGSAGPNGTHDQALAKGPGVVIGRSGASAGRVHFSAVDYWPHNTCLYVTDFCGNNPRFAYYLLQTLPLASFNSGSAQPSLNRNFLYSIPLRIPDRDEQDHIVSILQALDDRITLLRETNATLEAIAQALFKSWFVDFDPVRAKIEGRTPEGMDEATAALFPDSFEETELGAVPKGWRIGKLCDILALRNERTKPSEETKSLPYVPIESITAKVPFLQEHKSGDEANSSLILFRKGDILFGAMRPYFHKVCIAPFDGVTRTTVFTLKPINPKASGFALFMAFQESSVDYAAKHSEGSTIPYAKWKNSLENMPIVLPPESLWVAFSGVVSPFVDRANGNIEEAQNLATLRDTLLPRLISGQLRLPVAQDELEAA